MSLLSEFFNPNLSETTEKINAEYIWIGGSGISYKRMILSGPVAHVEQVPYLMLNYGGSSTGQAPGEDSELTLHPQAIFKDPFRRGNNILVKCDARTPGGEPIPTKKWFTDMEWFFSDLEVAAEVPCRYGLEQEYTLSQKDVNWPLGWPVGGYPGPQERVCCRIGADKSFGPDIVDAHYKACLDAGINISGIYDGVVTPGQWKFQVGPAVGISAGDQLWVARYILERISERYGVVVSFDDPNPIKVVWNGAGCPTKDTRAEGGSGAGCLTGPIGCTAAAFGEGNERRLGRHETADIKAFLWVMIQEMKKVVINRCTTPRAKLIMEIIFYLIGLLFVYFGN